MIKKALKDLTLGELAAVCKMRDSLFGKDGNTCSGCPLHAACEHGPDNLELDHEVEVPEEIGLRYDVNLQIDTERYVDEDDLKKLLTSVLKDGLKDTSAELSPDSSIRVSRFVLVEQ